MSKVKLEAEVATLISRVLLCLAHNFTSRTPGVSLGRVPCKRSCIVYAESRRSVLEHKLVMSKFVEPVNLEISPDSLSQGEQAILQQIALQLYARNIFTFGQARRLANLSVWEFQQLLGQQKIQRHYSETDLAEELDT